MIARTIIALLGMSLMAYADEKKYDLGVDLFTPAFLANYRIKKSVRIGLISNQTGKTADGQRTVDALVKRGFMVTALFAPEHGFSGTVQAGVAVNHATDKQTQLPIFSLYEHGRKKVPHAVFNAIDIFVFDMQDAGMRHYTYIATLLHAMQLAAHHKKALIILDRPNPLGSVMQGPVARQIGDSFLSSVPVPLRHGMTLGEIARYCNTHVIEKPIRLLVVPMKNYYRDQGLQEKLFTQLSPNIHSLDSCKGYSFLGLLGEIKPFDVGVGTEYAFTRFGLPEKYISTDALKRLVEQLETCGMQGSVINYKRHQHAHRGMIITMNPIDKIDSFSALLAILDWCKKEKVPLLFSKHFDSALGSPVVQDYYNGTISQNQLRQRIAEELKKFYAQARSAFIYRPLPRMMN